MAKYVASRREEIAAEGRGGRRHLEGMVPQQHEPGAEAEVDFADVWVRLAGEPVRCHLFTDGRPDRSSVELWACVLVGP